MLYRLLMNRRVRTLAKWAQFFLLPQTKLPGEHFLSPWVSVYFHSLSHSCDSCLQRRDKKIWSNL